MNGDGVNGGSTCGSNSSTVIIKLVAFNVHTLMVTVAVLPLLYVSIEVRSRKMLA